MDHGGSVASRGRGGITAFPLQCPCGSVRLARDAARHEVHSCDHFRDHPCFHSCFHACFHSRVHPCVHPCVHSGDQPRDRRRHRGRGLRDHRPRPRREDALHLPLAPRAADLLAGSSSGDPAVRARLAVDPAPRRGCRQPRERPPRHLRPRRPRRRLPVPPARHRRRDLVGRRGGCAGLVLRRPDREHPELRRGRRAARLRHQLARPVARVAQLADQHARQRLPAHGHRGVLVPPRAAAAHRRRRGPQGTRDLQGDLPAGVGRGAGRVEGLLPERDGVLDAAHPVSGRGRHRLELRIGREALARVRRLPRRLRLRRHQLRPAEPRRPGQSRAGELPPHHDLARLRPRRGDSVRVHAAPREVREPGHRRGELRHRRPLLAAPRLDGRLQPDLDRRARRARDAQRPEPPAARGLRARRRQRLGRRLLVLHGGGAELRLRRRVAGPPGDGRAEVPERPSRARGRCRACRGRRVGQRRRRLRKPAVPQLELAARARERPDRHRQRLGRGHPQLGRDHRRAEPCLDRRADPRGPGPARAHRADPRAERGEPRQRARVALPPRQPQLGLHVLRHRRRHGGQADGRLQRGDPRGERGDRQRRRRRDGADRVDSPAFPVESRLDQLRPAVRLPAVPVERRLQGVDLRARCVGHADGHAQVPPRRRRTEPARRQRERGLRAGRGRGRLAIGRDDAPRLPRRQLLQLGQHQLLRDARRDRRPVPRRHHRRALEARRLLRRGRGRARQRAAQPDPACVGRRRQRRGRRRRN